MGRSTNVARAAAGSIPQPAPATTSTNGAKQKRPDAAIIARGVPSRWASVRLPIRESAWRSSTEWV